jgi:hypothetical protein
MRIARIGSLAPALLLAGCLGQGGTVMLTVSQAMNVSPAVGNYSASNATAVPDSAGVIHFTATSGNGQITVELQGPIKQGDMLDLMTDHNNVSYDQTNAGWGSNGGMIVVDGVSPYKLRFVTIPMVPGSGTAKGNFVFDGSGTFD